jgi:hypothetical protein
MHFMHSIFYFAETKSIEIRYVRAIITQFLTDDKPAMYI